MRGGRLAISLALGLGISGAAMFLAFRKVQFQPLMDYMASINYWYVFPVMALAWISFLLRAWRWRIIMESSQRLGFWEAYHPMMIGFMMNCILPGRVGELARPAIMKQQKRVPFFETLATVAAERVFDLLILLGLFALVSAHVVMDPSLEVAVEGHQVSGRALERAAWAATRLSLVMIMGMLLVSIHATRELMERMVLASPGLLFFLSGKSRESIRKAVCLPVVGIIRGVAQGFAAVRNPGKVAACLALSVLAWACICSTYVVMAMGCPGMDMTLMQFGAMMVIICFAISLPSAPGFWGLWEAAGIFAMALFGVSRDEAAGFTLVNHVIQLSVPIVAGLISAVLAGVSIRQISRAGRRAGENGEGPESPLPQS